MQQSGWKNNLCGAKPAVSGFGRWALFSGAKQYDCSRHAQAFARGSFMRKFALALLAAIGGFALMTTVPRAQAQVAVEVGPAPDCPYGYFDTPPYACAPAGYYGPEWFTDGVFIGVGPWFHGHKDFHGEVDNHFHPNHGYKAELPHRGDKPDPSMRVDSAHFHGNETRDGRGHVVKGKH